LNNASRGSAPHRRRFGVLIAMTAVMVTGFHIAYTYITPFLLDVSGFSAGALGPLLLVPGLFGVLGIVAVGVVLDRRPWGSLIVPLVMLAVALLGLSAFGTARFPAVAMLALMGLAFGILPPAIQSRALQVAPGSTDVASAGLSVAFNIGIATGSFVGGILLASAGPRVVPLVGGALAALALALVLNDHRAAHR